ncbi:PepSY domain-containing protein [Methyloceanibacter sp. wino2]|uniref:PepSY domain-containing protein n=1 Tax=Methyloceanibacter sp. wino2 TaxID=2170729 RepID=UPI000D3E99F7|nr:PepSY domain-containing protein [Methyloceanibacter sp. wino2]
MRILITAFALMFAMTTTSFAADEALTEEQIEGVEMAIKAMGCTVEDTNIEMENDGYEADDVICEDDKQFDVYLDKDFKVTKKVAE